MLMIPGRINPRQLRNLMKQFGIQIEELKNVKEVTITFESGEKIHFTRPAVTVIKSQEGEMFQIIGKYKLVRESPSEAFTEEDIRIVMEKANVDRDQAIKALKKANGNPAEAIMLILSGEI